MPDKKLFFFVILREHGGYLDICLEMYKPSDSMTVMLPHIEAATLDEALVLLREQYRFSNVYNPRAIGSVVFVSKLEAEIYLLDVSDCDIRKCRGNGKIIDMYSVANHPDFPKEHEDWLKRAISVKTPFHIPDLQVDWKQPATL